MDLATEKALNVVGPFVANKNKVYVRSLSFTQETLAHLDLIPGVIGPLCRDTKRCTLPTLTELVARAPWREAVTYRDTWPHEYVLTGKDSQKELLAAVCERFRAGEGVACRFFRMNNTYLFIGDHKYWLMTDYNDEGDYYHFQIYL